MVERKTWIPKVGDLVRFRMGEREPLVCPSNGCRIDLLAGDPHTSVPLRYNDTILPVGEVFHPMEPLRFECMACGETGMTRVGSFNVLIRAPHEIDGEWYYGFMACDRELEPVGDTSDCSVIALVRIPT